MPGPAWLLLNKICISLFRALYFCKANWFPARPTDGGERLMYDQSDENDKEEGGGETESEGARERGDN